MLEWKQVPSGIRPVPDPAATSIVWAVSAAIAFALAVVFNLLDGQGDPTLDLVAVSVTVAAVSTGARLTAAPGTALLCWLVINAFATAPMGALTWEATYDLGRIACLLAAAGAGTVLARLAHARSAYHRLTP
ncbi:hypothetical protein ACFCYM_06970 [Streptomyces sp. NPDC056254]|uniref:hypothetical protein n=1 Tax=unclassified Streptomyces TaxID=2593676 RepID=UPI0004AAC3EB|nr:MULTISPECIES: hypothetical protein [unclassified Streptomyces]APU43244.1 hypothetical protein BSL84_29250 [Streptomyces sp. TN58]KJK53765.1 hypothetical protein UK14_05450 [Streptomyces sp. NRRL F-4428]